MLIKSKLKRVEKPIKKFERLDIKKSISPENSALKPIKQVKIKKVQLPKN